MEKYQPINCNLYDVLEAHATLREEVTIAYFESGKSVKTIQTKIKTLVTKNKEEFLVLPDDGEIRLDQIISINDTQFYGSCGI